VAIISIIAAIAVPGLLRARMTGNESSAIASLRTTTSSQVSFSAACGNGGYAQSYTKLGEAPPGGGQGFISADLGSSDTPTKSGYNFAMEAGAAGAEDTPNDCAGDATGAGFYATATAVGDGTTGTRAFAVNANMTIWQNADDSQTPPTEEEMAGTAEEPGPGVSPIQ
jgi:hypothetical protein